MIDRELLGLAAKAAGIEGFYDPPVGEDYAGGIVGEGYERGVWAWNPLVDDGCALRLMSDLCLVTQVRPNAVFVTDIDGKQLGYRQIKRSVYAPYAATRRAIVLAAAELGKGMK